MGITSAQLADKAGVSRDTISRLENGDPSVSLATFLNVLPAYGLVNAVVDAIDPRQTDIGRARADQLIPQRVRTRR